ncbi:MAG: NYN domain-containing protein [Planctomycetes bacterium]|nr:NYN domain-containing protein [Planctomycetota bacterium]
MSRTAVFIDGAYLDHILRDDCAGFRLDYAHFSDRLAEGKETLRTYYYNCLPYQSNPPTAEERERFGKAQRFTQRLSRLPRYEVRLGALQYKGVERESGRKIFVQKRVDILLGVDLVLLAAKHQIIDAALVAGDSDFLPAVKAAKDEGVSVRLYHGRTSPPHNELWEAADERTLITLAFLEGLARADR